MLSSQTDYFSKLDIRDLHEPGEYDYINGDNDFPIQTISALKGLNGRYHAGAGINLPAP